MEVCRKFTASFLTAMILAVGVVASTHTHVHESNIDGSTAHHGHCSHVHHNCDDDLSEADSEHRNTAVPCNDDHEDCQICKLLTSFDSMVHSSVSFHFDSLVNEAYSPTDVFIVSWFSGLASVRGPPA